MGATKYKIGDKVPLQLELNLTPTGTPTFEIQDVDGTITVVAAPMTSGSGLYWYGTYTIAGGTGNGIYKVVYRATIDSIVYVVTEIYEVVTTELTDVETKIDTIDTNVDSVLVDTGTTIPATLTTIDTVVDAIQARTDVIATATEDNTVHGSGSWEPAAGGSGLYNITINVKAASVNVQAVTVSIHNAANDDTPYYLTTATDASGNTGVYSLDAGSYTVRASKAGYTFANTAITVSATGTKNVTGTADTVSSPASPDLCRVRCYPINLDNTDVASLVIEVGTAGEINLLGDTHYITNTEDVFTLDTATTPDSYYFDAVQGSVINIYNELLGFNHEVTVPAATNVDLATLITS